MSAFAPIFLFNDLHHLRYRVTDPFQRLQNTEACVFCL